MRSLIIAAALSLACLASDATAANTVTLPMSCPAGTTFFKLNPVGQGYPVSNWAAGVQCCRVIDNTDPHHPKLGCFAKVLVPLRINPGVITPKPQVDVTPEQCPPGYHISPTHTCIKNP